MSFFAVGPPDRYTSNDPRLYLNAEYEGEILFTYDVTWDKTTMPWTQRWALLLLWLLLLALLLVLVLVVALVVAAWLFLLVVV